MLGPRTRAGHMGVFTLLVHASGVIGHACTRNYTIQEGDTCDAISAANNVSTYQLAAVNPGIDAACSNLLPDETLCLGTEDQDCNEIYVVKPDDTCDIVAASQGINSTMVRFNNPQIDEECTNLYIGEVLCICDLVKVPVFQDRPSPDPTSTPVAVPTEDASVDEDEDEDVDDEDLPECEDD